MEVDLKNTGSLSFPRYCPRCLTPNPERTFSLRLERPSFNYARAVEKWTLNVPICEACSNSKLKRTLMLYIPAGVGVLIFIASIAIAVSISAAQEQTAIFLMLAGSLVAGILSFCSVFLLLKRMPKPPVELISAGPSSIRLSFENDMYGKIFSEANKGILLT